MGNFMPAAASRLDVLKRLIDRVSERLQAAKNRIFEPFLDSASRIGASSLNTATLRCLRMAPLGFRIFPASPFFATPMAAHPLFAAGITTGGSLESVIDRPREIRMSRDRGGCADEAKEKAPVTFVTGAIFVRTLAVTYSRMAAATLSSARSVFTSEFEMGSGGSRSL